MCLLPLFFYRRHQNKLFYLFIMSLNVMVIESKTRKARVILCVCVKGLTNNQSPTNLIRSHGPDGRKCDHTDPVAGFC